MHIVIYGDVIRGFKARGPFSTRAAAQRYAESNAFYDGCPEVMEVEPAVEVEDEDEDDYDPLNDFNYVGSRDHY